MRCGGEADMVNKLNELRRCQASTQWNAVFDIWCIFDGTKIKKKGKKSLLNTDDMYT